jgi:hypothetical protein
MHRSVYGSTSASCGRCPCAELTLGPLVIKIGSIRSTRQLHDLTVRDTDASFSLSDWLSGQSLTSSSPSAGPV